MHKGKVFALFGLLAAAVTAVTVRTPAATTPFAKDSVFATDSNTADHPVVWRLTDGDKKIEDDKRLFATVDPRQTGTPWICPMAFGPDGHLYVVARGGNGTLFDVTAGGDLSKAKPVATNLFTVQPSKLCGMVFDQAGNAYITNSESGMQPVDRVAPDGKITTLKGQFDRPRGLAIQGDTLYIAESGTGSVLAYNLKDDSVKPYATGFEKINDHTPGSLVIDPRGRLLTLWKDADGNANLYDITGGGSFTGKQPLLQVGFRMDINQMAVDSKNNLYIAGDGSGTLWQCKFSNGKFAAEESFADDLGDHEAVAVAP